MFNLAINHMDRFKGALFDLAGVGAKNESTTDFYYSSLI